MKEVKDTRKRLFFHERRRRLKRPLSLIIFGISFILLFPINYISIALKNDIALNYPQLVFETLNTCEIVIIVMTIPVGIGLLTVTKWGIWFFLAYSPVLIVYKLGLFISDASVYNINAVIQSFFVIAAVIFFTSRDFLTPYLQTYSRGWRPNLRRPIRMGVTINGNRRNTRDMSKAGLYVNWRNCVYEPGIEVNVTFTLNKNRYSLKAGIVRVDTTGVGVAFRYMQRDIRRRMYQDLQELEKMYHEEHSSREQS